jgi:hypothetical protein
MRFGCVGNCTDLSLLRSQLEEQRHYYERKMTTMRRDMEASHTQTLDESTKQVRTFILSFAY